MDVNSSGNNIDDNVKKFELNPVRTSAVGFPVEDLLPIINKKSKTSQNPEGDDASDNQQRLE